MSVETVDGVTFEGGHAIEQDGGADGPEEGSQHADEISEAKAAVRKALAKEAGEAGAGKAKETEEKRKRALNAKSDREAAEDGDDEDEAPESKPEPKKPEPKAKDKEEDIDPNKASVREILKNREKLARAKQQQAQEIQQNQQYIQQLQAQVQQERQAIERERQRLALLRKDPVRAITEAGWDPDDLILSLAQEGTPEGKMARMVREQQLQLQQMQSWREEQAREAQRQQEQYQHHQLIQARQNVERAFVQGALDESRYPHLADFYKGREYALIAEGDVVAGMVRDAVGREPTLEEIALAIEEELAERANSWYQKKYGTQKSQNEPRQVATPDTAGKSPRGAKGKALSGSVTSERRALGKDLTSLDAEERLLTAREAVKVAMAAARDE
jgi:hypothetical protein